ncbi:MAG: proton-conducting transporter membrane subunit [Conexivisphaera sp.]
MAIAVLLVQSMIYLTLATGLAVPLVGRRWRIALSLAVLGSLAFLVASAASLYLSMSASLSLYGGLVVQDPFSSMILLGASVSSLLALVAMGPDASKWSTSPAAFSLVPLVLFGTFFLAGAADALVVLATWLIVSVASYVFIALPDDASSKAASVRYIMVGIVATLFLMAWAAVDSALQAASSFAIVPLGAAALGARGLALAAVIAALAAVGFKLGLFPFHWWLPNVYGRADGRVVSFVAGVVKLGFIAIIARILIVAAAGPLSAPIALTAAAVAVITMIYGNFAALSSRSFQMILSYSSMAQVGYIMTAIAAAAYFAGLGPAYRPLLLLAYYAVAIQAVAYSLAKVPLFALAGEAGGRLTSVRGMLSSSPAAAVSASLLLLSLLGLPPLLGFWGKLYMFLAASGYSIWLAVLALVNSGISAFYYAVVIREMLAKGEGPRVEGRYLAALLAGAAAVLAIGIIAPLLLGYVSSVFLG